MIFSVVITFTWLLDFVTATSDLDLRVTLVRLRAFVVSARDRLPSHDAIL